MVAKMKWRMLVTWVVMMGLMVNRANSSAEVMKKMTVEFSKGLEECKKELTLGDHILEDLNHFWKEDYDLVHNDVGCAIMCMATKLNLVANNQIHHGNAHAFAKTHGADDDTAKELGKILKDCEDANLNIHDDCAQILSIAKCFRTGVHRLKWAPDMETLLVEVMTDM